METKRISEGGEFVRRHIGPTETEVEQMLAEMELTDLEELITQAMPESIRTKHTLSLGEGRSEYALLTELKQMMAKNQVFKSYLGQGFHPCITPTVIQRNILESPAWYTAYTPYQAEISQGRLEALLNFQTMVSELTRMDLANASLLDEGTAAAEAMSMAKAFSKKKEASTLLASKGLHPHIIEVLKTRAEPVGIQVEVTELSADALREDVFAVLIAYPESEGRLQDYAKFSEFCKKAQIQVIVDVDLLSLTLLRPPGEWGADIVVGNSQRFGVPLGYGGPHAAFLATREDYKRLIPGRIVGVSVDKEGKSALRLALQTREQHIRRERATSNICTAQVLLANMAGMYAVYHGPEGLKKIAQRIHQRTRILAEGLKSMGFEISHELYFDTLRVQAKDASTRDKILEQAKARKINLLPIDNRALGLSLNETTSETDIEELWDVFGLENQTLPSFKKMSGQLETKWPQELLRQDPFMQQKVFNRYHSESELLRYIYRLQSKDITLAHSMIPLGSCTMKLNSTTELAPVSWPEVNSLHPFAPLDQVKGYQEMIFKLEEWLAQITGFAGVSLSPNAGSQGEYAGLLVIRKYHQEQGQGQRDICLIPSSAHGTNPASAVLAGMKVVTVACDSEGNIDIEDLKKKAEEHREKLAALMITYPSTHGVFEEGVKEICSVIHDYGGQVYLDGANFNALVGLCRPQEFGADVCHLNLHKTFAIPHGGGGPGVGPIGVAEHLKAYLPKHKLEPGRTESSVNAITSAPWGSASILPISWSYLALMGSQGVKRATEVAILNANYIAHKLKDHYPVLYKGRQGRVAHECILDVRDFKRSCGVDVNDIAKRLIDYGFHAPTMSWPVPGTLMIEPTESESKEELDRFIAAMIQIRQEIGEIEAGEASQESNVLVNSPHTLELVTGDAWDLPYSREKAAYPLAWVRERKIWPGSARVDNAHGDRNLMCSCS